MGAFSILLFPRGEVSYGLPLFPKQYQAVDKIDTGDHYACMYCGHVEQLSTPNERCSRCHNKYIGSAKAINIEVIR